MCSLSHSNPTVKEIQSGGFSPDEEDKALLESNLSASSGPSGASSPAPFWNTPDGLKAINSPATDDVSPKTVSHASLRDSGGSSSSSPSSVGLSNSLVVNCDTLAITQITEDFRLHKYKLAGTPGIFVHLLKKSDNSEALYHTSPTAQSRYFPEGRAYIQERLMERLGTKRQAGVFLSLTVAASDYEIQDAWSMMWRRFKGLRDGLNIYRRRHMNAGGSLIYLAVLEQCKSGYPHMHVFFPGLRWIIKRKDLHKMDEWWKMGSARTEKEHEQESAQSYVLKYVSKLDGWSEMSMAFLWKFHLRLYNLSHSVYLKPPEREWEVIGRYTSAKEMSRGLGITVNKAESIIDGGGRFIPLETDKEVREGV